MGSNASLCMQTQNTEQNTIRGQRSGYVNTAETLAWLHNMLRIAAFIFLSRCHLLHSNASEHMHKWLNQAKTVLGRRKKNPFLVLAKLPSSSLLPMNLRTQSASPCAAAWPRKQPWAQLWTRRRRWPSPHTTSAKKRPGATTDLREGVWTETEESSLMWVVLPWSEHLGLWSHLVLDHVSCS